MICYGSTRTAKADGMPLRVQLLLLLGTLLLPNAVTADFLATPIIAWTHDLPDTSIVEGGGNADSQQRQQQPQLRQLQQQQDGGGDSRIGLGNAVAVSPDGSQIFVTESNGALHMGGSSSTTVSSSGKAKRSSWTFAPNATQASSASDAEAAATTMVTSCRSGVAFFGDEVVVYAVTERPISNTGDDSDDVSTQLATSQVYGVRRSNGRLAWSVSVGGTVVGTPWVSQNHVYVVRNTATNGYVTVLEVSDGGKDATAIATIPDPAAGTASALGWLGPLAGRPVTLNGKEQDVVVVARASSPDANNGNLGDSDGGGGGPNDNNQDNTDTQGGLYAVVPSADYDSLSGRTADAYDLRIISSYPLVTDLPPVFDGTSVYLAHQARLSGWEGADQDLSTVFDGTNQDRSPTWEMRRSDGDSAPGRPPVVSAFGLVGRLVANWLDPTLTFVFLVFTFKSSRAPQCSRLILRCCWFLRPAQGCRAATLHRVAPYGATRTTTLTMRYPCCHGSKAGPKRWCTRSRALWARFDSMGCRMAYSNGRWIALP
jgi:hypothetical protein